MVDILITGRYNKHGKLEYDVSIGDVDPFLEEETKLRQRLSKASLNGVIDVLKDIEENYNT